MLQPEHTAGAAKAGDNLIGYQQHIVLVAYLANAREIIILWYEHTTSALDRFCNKHCDCFGTFFEDLLFQFVGSGYPLTGGIIGRLIQIRVRTGNMDEPWNSRLKHFPIRRHSGRTHRGKSNTMVSPDSRNHLGFLRLTFKFPVVTRQFDIAIGCLPATGGEVKMINIRVGEARQAFG